MICELCGKWRDPYPFAKMQYDMDLCLPCYRILSRCEQIGAEVMRQ